LKYVLKWVQRRLLWATGLVRRRSASPPSVPSSRERLTFRLRLLPPGPGQVRPSNARTPSYEGVRRNRRPRRAGHRWRASPYAPLPPATQKVTDPLCSPLRVRGRAGSPILPAAASVGAEPTGKSVTQPMKHGGYSLPLHLRTITRRWSQPGIDFN